MPKRIVQQKRNTKETQVALVLNLDGKGQAKIGTTLPPLDHFLTLLAYHGFFDLAIKAKGDTKIDAHHLAEDIGLVLGEAFAKALGAKKGIKRYGQVLSPMDEALVLVAADISGRPHLGWQVKFSQPKIGGMDIDVFPEFWQAFVNRAGIALHVQKLSGSGGHHLVEAIFKGCGRALGEAVAADPRRKNIPSSKGVL